MAGQLFSRRKEMLRFADTPSIYGTDKVLSKCSVEHLGHRRNSLKASLRFHGDLVHFFASSRSFPFPASLNSTPAESKHRLCP